MTDNATKSGMTTERFYGRRKGRPLSPRKQALVDGLLPKVEARPDNVADLEALFGTGIREHWMEIGFGGGEHLAHQARQNPSAGIIGCEPFIDGVAKLLGNIEEEGLSNIRIWPDDARPLLDALPDAALDRVFILFADPWPKKRHNFRRFVNPDNLDRLARVMKPGAELRLASDHMDYIRWMLFHMGRDSRFEWVIEGPGDWRSRPSDWTPTRYEEKALAKGISCVYLRYVRR